VANWYFATPTSLEGPASWEDWLFMRVRLDRGVTILEGPPGTYRAVQFPTQDEIAASAPGLYMGGHISIVDDATRAALIAGGVGVTAANFTPAP
jgi:hypothetical protein